MVVNPPRSFDLFPRSREVFSDALFKKPPNEYRGTPLWSWNNELNLDQLLRQIDDLETMGLGGFHMHVRVGLDTEYLSAEFMDLVQKCVERAKQKGMLAWLYDEDRWPSGFAGGRVTDNEDRFRSRHLLMTPWKYGDPECPHQNMENHSCSAVAMRSELGFLVARYSIKLDDAGFLVESRRLKEGEGAENVWYAYVETNPPSEWFNGAYYVDTLNKDAMQRFVEETYEPYKKAVGSEFGKTIPAIFTDEPQFAMKNQLKRAHGKRDIFLPWTLDLEDTYRETYMTELLDEIPEVIWDIRGPSRARYNYHDHVCDRFVEAFTDKLGDWCNQNHIALTGHMMMEPTLRSQTSSTGEAMRCYRNMHLPGIDMLCDRHEYTTAKQAQSVSRQYGRCGVLSEIYGVTNWTFTFEGHKGSGDWQAALGVNVRCHHLSWVTMAGEAKRDYPAAIGYQSPWYTEYSLVEDHFARVNTALSRGKASVKVAVVHPIESFWLAFGPNETSIDQDERERQFGNLTEWLCFGLIDFDFLSESLLPVQGARIIGGKFAVGHSEYDAVILPNLHTIRSSTLTLVEQFARAGGRVIVAGSDPTLVDVSPSSRPSQLLAKRVPFARLDILGELEYLRDLKVVLDSGSAADSLLYQMRCDSEERYVFICNTDRVNPRESRIELRGDWDVTLLDTLTGDQRKIDARPHRGWTEFEFRLEGCASMLLRLQPKSAKVSLPLVENPVWKVSEDLSNCKVSLSEPNVLLLDNAKHRIDDDVEWSRPEEILRVDNIARAKLGLSLKKDDLSQPYRAKKITPKHTLHLLFEFNSAISISGAQLAIEGAADTKIELDGCAIPAVTTGWWVDEAINTVALPSFDSGVHELTLSIPFAETTNIERVYILGSFGVDLRGRHATIVELHADRLQVGDYTRQGLPFYAGNVIYDFSLKGKDHTAIQVNRFAAPLLSVALDGQPAGKIAFQPHILDLGVLDPSEHRLRIIAYGNRDHAFGAVHLPDGMTKWYGPDAWRTSGNMWSYEYTIREMGILTAPRVLTTNERFVGAWDEGSISSYL